MYWSPLARMTRLVESGSATVVDAVEFVDKTNAFLPDAVESLYALPAFVGDTESDSPWISALVGPEMIEALARAGAAVLTERAVVAGATTAPVAICVLSGSRLVAGERLSNSGAPAGIGGVFGESGVA